MADLSGLTNAFSTITGTTSKASILIADQREEAKKVAKPKKPVEAGVGGPGGIPTGSVGALAKKGSRSGKRCSRCRV